jgi:histone H3/H4
MSGRSRRSPSPAQTSHAKRKPSYGPSHDADIRNLAPVARIMKTALPENAKIAKEAKECMQECVSEFISFITSEGRSRSEVSRHMLAVARLIADVGSSTFSVDSFGEMSAGEAKNCQWRGYPFCDDVARVRKLCRGLEDLSLKIPRSKYRVATLPLPYPYPSVQYLVCRLDLARRNI